MSHRSPCRRWPRLSQTNLVEEAEIAQAVEAAEARARLAAMEPQVLADPASRELRALVTKAQASHQPVPMVNGPLDGEPVATPGH